MTTEHEGILMRDPLKPLVKVAADEVLADLAGAGTLDSVEEKLLRMRLGIPIMDETRPLAFHDPNPIAAPQMHAVEARAVAHARTQATARCGTTADYAGIPYSQGAEDRMRRGHGGRGGL